MTIEAAYISLSNLNLWYTTQTNDELMHSHVPELIPLRWPTIRDNWEVLKINLVNRLSQSGDQDTLKQKIDDFSNLVERQRYAAVNPLSNFKTVVSYYAIFELLPISIVQASNEEQTIVEKAVSTATRYSRNNFLKIKKDLQEYHDELADAIGRSDPDYNRIVGRTSNPTTKTATPADIAILQVLMGAIKAVDFVLANTFDLPTVSIDPFALARANANNPDFAINSHNNGSLVRMNYGETLADLATRYLGSSDRWMEIAIANGLKPPYIDEVGEKVLLSSNGNVNQVNLPATDNFGKANKDKFYISQNIILQSNTIPFPESRSVMNIKIIPVSGEIVLELSGDSDLDRYKSSEGAYVRVFKPNTMNSNFFILIPEGIVALDTPQKDTPWFLQSSKEDEKQALVDVLLSDSNDLVFGATGDLALAYGLANAQQALKSKVSVEQGSLLRHPDYGIVSIAGTMSNKKEAAQDILSQSIVSSVEADKRFSRVDSLSITALEGDGTGFLVQLVVRLAGSDSPIPVTFTITPS